MELNQEHIKASTKSLLHRTGGFNVVRRLPPVGPTILFFHKVQRADRGVWGEPVLSADEFELQMAFIARHFEPVSLSELVAGLKGERTLSPRAVAVTFDDGYRNNLILAAPILRRHRISATLFITTGPVGTDRWMWAYELEAMLFRFGAAAVADASGEASLVALASGTSDLSATYAEYVSWFKARPTSQLHAVMDRLRARFPIEVDDENRFLSWEEVSELPSHGFELGGHTVTHPILPRLSLEEAEREIAQCRDDLERHTKTRPTLFAYPNGETTPELSRITGRYFEAAVTDKPGVCLRGTNVLEIPRLYGTERGADLAARLMSLHVRQLWTDPAELFAE